MALDLGYGYYEACKKLFREQRSQAASGFLSQCLGFQERVIPIDIPVAEFAARVGGERRLAMADAMIYAVARLNRARLVTADFHFSGLDGVTLI